MRSERGKTALRCAIYARVSTEHGLEQEFNSLDNQREASEAYVKSQAHEGWKLIRTHYDDGGYSGGSIDRPALKKLLDDVERPVFDPIAEGNHAAHPNALPLREAILSRIRSPVTSRSNWAKDKRTFRVSRPMLVVVLNAWVTETKDT